MKVVGVKLSVQRAATHTDFLGRLGAITFKFLQGTDNKCLFRILHSEVLFV